MTGTDHLLGRRSTGVYLDYPTIHAAQVLNVAGKSVLEKAVTAELKSPEDLRAFFMIHGLDSSRLIFCIPRQLAVLSYLDIPSTRPREIAKMVSLEALRKMPFAPEEFVADYEVLSSDSEGNSKILMMVVRISGLKELLDRLGQADIQPQKIVLSTQAFSRLVGLKKSPGTIVSVELGAASAGFDLLEDGRLVFTRSVSLGALKDASRLANLRSELEVTLEACRSQRPLTEPLRFALLPPPPGWEGVAKVLEERHHFRRLDPLAGVTRGQNLKWTEGLGPCAALGAALCTDGHVNFIPAEERRRFRQAARRGEWAKLGALALALTLVWAGIGLREMGRAQARFKQLSAEWRDIAPRVRELKLMAAQLRDVSEKNASRSSALDVLAALHRDVPRNITLSGISFEADGRLALRGTAPSLSAAVALVDRLEGSDIFEEIELRSSNLRRTRGRENVEFQVEGRVQ